MYELKNPKFEKKNHEVPDLHRRCNWSRRLFGRKMGVRERASRRYYSRRGQ
jgi:hypothetical protein